MKAGDDEALIALGGNLSLGEQAPRETLDAALDAIDRAGLRVLRRSRFYSTPCFPPGAGPDFVNAAAALDAEGDWDAARILALLHDVERRFGRVRRGRWTGRTLDLDLIALGALVLPDARDQDRWRALPLTQQMKEAPEGLVLPHPRVQDRAFVLVPLLDVAPHWCHPRLGLDVAGMLAALPEEARADIRPI